MGIPEGSERESVFKEVFNEITSEKSPNMEIELRNNIHEEHKTPNRIDQR